MPLIQHSTYKVSLPWLKSAHFQTVWPTLFRKVAPTPYERERFSTLDGDFFDVDWLRSPGTRLMVILHGLEGSAQSNYVRGMALAAASCGWSIAAINFRGCSGETNLLPSSYHSGFTNDLHQFIDTVQEAGIFTIVTLVGFSVGGNIVLKYLGEVGNNHPQCLKAAVTISVPINLRSSAEQLSKPYNAIYLRRFLKMLCDKVRIKNSLFAHIVPESALAAVKSFREFDDLYTAPIHGFKDATDYWSHASSINYLTKISLPTLLLNAHNDSFLTPDCFPTSVAQSSEALYLEIPRWGGHVGFMPCDSTSGYWSELRSIEFLAAAGSA